MPMQGGDSLQVFNTKTIVTESSHVLVLAGFPCFYDNLGQKNKRDWVVGGALLYSASLIREGRRNEN